MPLCRAEDCNSYPSTSWEGCAPTSKELAETDFELLCQDLPKQMPPKPKQQSRSMTPTPMDVDPMSDRAGRGNRQDSGKSDSTAAEPRPSWVIPPDFGLFGTPPEEPKDDMVNMKSTQDSPDSTLDLPGSSAEGRVMQEALRSRRDPLTLPLIRRPTRGMILKGNLVWRGYHNPLHCNPVQVPCPICYGALLMRRRSHLPCKPMYYDGSAVELKSCIWPRDLNQAWPKRWKPGWKP